MPTMEEEYKKYQGENYDAINSMYDAQKQSTLSGLEEAYNRNVSNAEAAREQQGKQYQARANDLAVQHERNRRNLNQQAAANGLNTGAGSQMQLALGSNYQRDYGGIRTAQQQALDEANRGIEDLKAAYQSSVQQAIADNDYKRAQALLAEYQNQYAKQLQQAQTLASYGDFSAYLNIPGYTQSQVDAMRSSWIAQNPELAYRTGAISADEYYRMTGQLPAGSAGTYAAGRTTTGRTLSGDLNGDGIVGALDDAILSNGLNGATAGLTAGAVSADAVGRQKYDSPIFNRVFGALTGIQAKSPNSNRAPDVENAIYRIETSRDPQADMEKLLNSPYYDQMTDEQKERLATAYEHATLHAQTVPGIGEAGYYVDPSLRTGPGGTKPNVQYDR